MDSLINGLNIFDGGTIWMLHQILEIPSTVNYIQLGFDNITGIDKSNEAIFEGKREFKDI